jgi:hypothetical protein
VPEPRRLIFLDIDGTLNTHNWMEWSGSNDIDRECVLRLNRVLESTGAGIVVSSAWRYMVAGGAMTCEGFHYMLRTHGLTRRSRIVGITGPDDDLTDPDERGRQVADWLATRRETGLVPADVRYVVLDDGDFGITKHGHPFVHVDGRRGLTDADADRAVAILLGGAP